MLEWSKRNQEGDVSVHSEILHWEETKLAMKEAEEMLSEYKHQAMRSLSKLSSSNLKILLTRLLNRIVPEN